MRQLDLFTVHQNSLHAWETQVKPNLSQRKQDVVNALRYLGGATMKQVAAYLNIELHKVSGRFGELRKMGLIKEKEVVNNNTIWELCQ